MSKDGHEQTNFFFLFQCGFYMRRATKLQIRWNVRISMFHRAFFNSIIDKHQRMHFTFNNILV